MEGVTVIVELYCYRFVWNSNISLLLCDAIFST